MVLKKRPHMRNILSGQHKVSLTSDEVANIQDYEALQILFADGGVSKLMPITDAMVNSIESQGDYHLMCYKSGLRGAKRGKR